ncbi:hypothetical protein [Butyrivibrio sp. AE2032]|uniref:hypothetical protein n=1 Tax=Butyrivibrio sp. AE2032 TaxID=1458463 RepID=UPI0005535680|nr:hypothetical protein [Butyrivibrio sp. AE2032]
MIDMGLLKFIITKALAIVFVLALIFSDGHLRRRDTVESKRIFQIAVLIAVAAFFDMFITWVDWTFYVEPGEKGALFHAIFIALLNVAREMVALQVVVGWNLYVDYAIFHSYEHVQKKFKKSFIPAVIISVIFIVVYMALTEGFFYEGFQTVQAIAAFGYICIALQVFYLINAIQIVLKAHKGRKPPSFLRLDAFLVPVILGFFIYLTQILMQYGLLPFNRILMQNEVRDLCLAIAVVLTWISVRNRYKYVDPVTGLYNREFLSSMNEYMEKSGYPNGIGICFKAPGSEGKLIPVLNSIKPMDAEIFSLGKDEYLVMAGPQSQGAIRLLIKAATLRASETDSSMKVESSYAIRQKEESPEAFTNRLLTLAG